MDLFAPNSSCAECAHCRELAKVPIEPQRSAAAAPQPPAGCCGLLAAGLFALGAALLGTARSAKDYLQRTHICILLTLALIWNVTLVVFGLCFGHLIYEFFFNNSVVFLVMTVIYTNGLMLLMMFNVAVRDGLRKI